MISIGINLLKIYDGTNWIEAGGLKRGDSIAVANPLQVTYGQIQITQQLYIFTGSCRFCRPLIRDGLAPGVRPNNNYRNR